MVVGGCGCSAGELGKEWSSLVDCHNFVVLPSRPHCFFFSWLRSSNASLICSKAVLGVNGRVEWKWRGRLMAIEWCKLQGVERLLRRMMKRLLHLMIFDLLQSWISSRSLTLCVRDYLMLFWTFFYHSVPLPDILMWHTPRPNWLQPLFPKSTREFNSASLEPLSSPLLYLMMFTLI